MTLRKSTATTDALERIVRVMQAKLGQEIANVADVDITMSVPDVDDYWILGADQIDRAIITRPIAVIVSQTAPSDVQGPSSGDGATYALHVQMPISVRLFFSADAYQPLNRTGRPQTREEYYGHASRRYAGAIIECLYKYAPDDVSVDRIELTSDMATPITIDGLGLIGSALLEWTVYHEARVPADVRQLTPTDFVPNP